jgi:hypothetical protein
VNLCAPFRDNPFAAAALFTDGLAVWQDFPAAIYAGTGRLAAAQQGLCSTGGTVNDTTDEAAAVKIFLVRAAGAAFFYRCPTQYFYLIRRRCGQRTLNPQISFRIVPESMTKGSKFQRVQPMRECGAQAPYAAW